MVLCVDVMELSYTVVLHCKGGDALYCKGHTDPPHLWQLSNNSKLAYLWSSLPVGPSTCGQSVNLWLAHYKTPVNKKIEEKLVLFCRSW